MKYKNIFQEFLVAEATIKRAYNCENISKETFAHIKLYLDTIGFCITRGINEKANKEMRKLKRYLKVINKL